MSSLQLQGQFRLQRVFSGNSIIPLWSFPTPTTGTGLSGVQIGTINGSTYIYWGDGSSTLAPAFSSVSKTY